MTRGAAAALALALALCLAAVLPPGTEPAAAADRLARWPADAVPGSLLVTAVDADAADRLAQELRWGSHAALTASRVVRLGSRVVAVRTVPGAEAAARDTLTDVAGVVAVDPDRVREPAVDPDDPGYPRQWAHRQTDAASAWDVSTGRMAVRVAVLDDGILGTHPDLRDNIVEPQVSTATGRVREVGTRVDNDPCRDGHGTLVAGVIGAVGDNARDVTGVSWRVSLVDISLASPEVGCDGFTDSAILAGMSHAISNSRGPVDVINLSFGGLADSCPRSFQSLIADARDAGAVVVAAAGNYGTSEAVIPASCNGVISVGATGPSAGVAPYSNRNPYLDLVAPGGDSRAGEDGMVLTTSRHEPIRSTELVEGTSFAAPYVAGVAALIRSARAGLTPGAVESTLERSARDIGVAGRDQASGWGIVQAGAAVRAAVAGSFPESPEPDPQFPVSGSGEGVPPPDGDPEVFRIAAKQDTTQAIPQAVAVSYAVFDDGAASHAILARNDNFADALAGSALGNGAAPLLFTRSSGPLATLTKNELRRVLPRGRTVYLLGGPNALPTALERELRDMGFQPARLAGPSREETAVAVAREVQRRRFTRISATILATRGNWPDAVTGGSIAAAYGTPILLTSPDRLHPATARVLRTLNPRTLYGLGGTGAISRSVLREAARNGNVSPDNTVRLAGAARDATAVAIAREQERLLAEVDGIRPTYATAVNVRRGDGWAHVLSAAIIPGRFGGVFVPVEGTSGQILTRVTRDYVAGLGTDGVLVGSRDIIVDRTGRDLHELLSR